MIYIDNNATTRPLPEVVAGIVDALERDWGNPSSGHLMGDAARRLVEKARRHVAELLGAYEDSVVFTSGATEANEAVLRHHLARGRLLVTSGAEHPSVDGLYEKLAPELIRHVEVDGDGLWDMDGLDSALAEGPALVAVGWASGETGVIQDARRIGEIAAAHGAPVLLDASQAVGRMRFAARNLPVTHLSFSGHKLHAPKGIGVLANLGETDGDFLLQAGGGQESGLRGGTENVIGIVGLGVACELRGRGLNEAIDRLGSDRDAFESRVLAALPQVRINGAGAKRVPNTTNMTFPDVDGMALVAQLEEAGVLCSQVSACSSARPEPSAALMAMGLDEEAAFSSARFSFAVDNRRGEAEAAADAVIAAAGYLNRNMAMAS